MLLFVDTTADSLLYTQTSQFEGVEYSLRFLWAERESCWYMDIGDQNGQPIAPFIRLVCGASLLRRFTDPRLPQGFLACVDLTGAGLDIQVPGDLGTRVPLVYLTSDDPLVTG